MSESANAKEDHGTKFSDVRLSLDAARVKVQDLIKTLLDTKNIKYDKIEGRTKTLESFLEKLKRPGKTYSSPLEEITDLVGIRIILYYTKDIEPVSKIIRSEFSIDSANSLDKAASLKPNEFGYQSVHFVAQLDKRRACLPEWQPVGRSKFEIQIRTVLQHAWASISHALQYKNEAAVPEQQQRRLFRLAGLLEIADQEFVELHTEKSGLEQKVGKQIEEHPQEVSIDSVSLFNYFAASSTVHEITAAAKAAGFEVYDYPKKKEAWSYYSNFLASLCQDLGLKSIGQLDSVLRSRMKSAPAIFSKLVSISHAEISRGETSLARWGAAAAFCIAILLFAVHPALTEEYLETKGWERSVANRLIRAVKETQ